MSAIREGFKIVGRTLAVLALVLSLTPGCITEPDTVDNNASNAMVEIVSMLGQAVLADGPGDAVTDLFSDVCFAGPTDTSCSIFNDNGLVTMRAFPKDRTQLSTAELGINSVTFERYRVTYNRADGRNVAGVDVPYAFDGATNFTLSLDGTEVERGFIVVRHQAKAESPLREIQSNFAATLSVIARIDFYGHDGSGRTVTATGFLNITFADFTNQT
jgi:hypothetical protein